MAPRITPKTKTMFPSNVLDMFELVTPKARLKNIIPNPSMKLIIFLSFIVSLLFKDLHLHYTPSE